jgi:hypothetical protein
MDITRIYNRETLADLKTSNDAYIVNKAMYQELNTIRLKILGHNNLYGASTSSYVTHQYTSVANNDYFGSLLQKLSVMFPDSYIYFTLNSVSLELTSVSVLYSSPSFISNDAYNVSSTVITNTIFISCLPLTIPSL